MKQDKRLFGFIELHLSDKVDNLSYEEMGRRERPLIRQDFYVAFQAGVE